MTSSTIKPGLVEVSIRIDREPLPLSYRVRTLIYREVGCSPIGRTFRRAASLMLTSTPFLFKTRIMRHNTLNLEGKSRQLYRYKECFSFSS
jgi:hypothetical protein